MDSSIGLEKDPKRLENDASGAYVVALGMPTEKGNEILNDSLKQIRGTEMVVMAGAWMRAESNHSEDHCLHDRR